MVFLTNGKIIRKGAEGEENQDEKRELMVSLDVEYLWDCNHCQCHLCVRFSSSTGVKFPQPFIAYRYWLGYLEYFSLETKIVSFCVCFKLIFRVFVTVGRLYDDGYVINDNRSSQHEKTRMDLAC